jgi:hypothetical protein
MGESPPIGRVGWDADQVLYAGLITSMCAEYSTLDPEPFVSKYIEEGLFTQDDVDTWINEYNDGKPIERIADVANMATDFFYTMRREGQRILEKEDTKRVKQGLLRGLTMQDIIVVSDRIEQDPGYNPGALEAIRMIRGRGIAQALYSDGLGPHIVHQCRKLGMDAGEGVPPIVRYPAGTRLPNGTEVTDPKGKVVQFEAIDLAVPTVELTGEIVKFDKATRLFGYLQNNGPTERKPRLDSLAVIDDSTANITPLLRSVHQAGGIAIAYPVKDKDKSEFQQAGIPVLDDTDLRKFAEIVLDRSKLEKYCV